MNVLSEGGLGPSRRPGGVLQPPTISSAEASPASSGIFAIFGSEKSKPNVTSLVAPNVTPNERRKWLLGDLARDVRITRHDIEKLFSVAARTVKRDLKDLLECGLIEFVRAPHPGHYRLAER
ncbi:MAG: hypothetical protein AMK72_02990 [Planctomycetes bacterium SM23_25]|nr:MAG: hypothetical protein AMK72_02990 [Planctomycetes bacterium SM23_25]